MNDDLQNNSFDELLHEALQDYVHGQPRPGLDRRILANLPAQRFPVRWLLGASVAAALALLLAAVSLRLSRPNALHQAAQQATVATMTSAPPLAVPRAASRIATTQVQEHSAPSRYSASGSTAVALSNPSRQIVPLTPESSAPPRQFLPVVADAEASAQTPNPADAANSDLEIKPIHIAAIVIPPLPGPDADSQPIPPTRIEPIKIAPIQISSLEIDRPNPNQ